MTDSQIARKIAMTSNEGLRQLVISSRKVDAFLRYHAKVELSRRDRMVTFGTNP